MRCSIRILISYVTAGTGHRRAAEAVAEAVRRHLPQAEVECSDLLGCTPRWFAWIYPRLYRGLVQWCAPLWGFGYNVIDQPWVFRWVQPIRRRWNRAIAARLWRRLRERPPDVAVATHFFPADVFASAKRAGILKARVVVVITDLFPHRVWCAAEADAFVVGSAPTAALCRQRGLTANRLHLLGIPVGSSFTQPLDRAAALQALGLEPGRLTVLMASGGMGVGPIEELVRRALAMDAAQAQRLQLIVVCGENDRLRRSLESLSRQACLPVAVRRRQTGLPVKVFGFVDTMPQLMRVSDLLVTKAGGLTVTEALAVGLPMMIFAVIPGQEELNARYVTSHGAAIQAAGASEAASSLKRFLDEPATLQTMRERARALAHPRAADDIVTQLILPDAPARS